MTKVRCGIIGLGPIGRDIARQAWLHPGFEVVAAVDVDPALAGGDLREVLGVDGRSGVTVESSPAAAVAGRAIDLMFHATGSRLEHVAGQFEELLRLGVNVISTCEELVFPWQRQPAVAERLDRIARDNGVTLVASGINPGFAMDVFPLLLAGATSRITSVHIERHTDVGVRRLPLQKKLGVGLSEADFVEREHAGELGHVGLEQSLELVADALGWEIGPVQVEIAPIVATSTPSAPHPQVPVGHVLGASHISAGRTADGRTIGMSLQMYVGADSRDSVTITGSPDIRVTVEGGFSGDVCTSAVILNLAPAVIAANPGLLTPADIRALRNLPSGASSR